MSSLFEITGELLRLMDMLDDPEQEVDEEAFLDTWEGMQYDFDTKVANWLKVVKNLEADIESRKKLIAELTEKNRKDENTINRMKETVKKAMELTNTKRAGNEILSATVCSAGGKLPLVYADGIREDARLLPEKYQKVETFYKADTDKIREDLDAGIPVPGVEYGERGSYLRIK